MFKQTIKVNILIIFILLISVISLSLLSSQYYFNVKIATNSINKTFKIVSQKISSDLSKERDIIDNAFKVNYDNQNFYPKISLENSHPALNDLIYILKLDDNAYSAHVTHKDGSFYQVLNMNRSSKLFSKLKAPKNARWTSVARVGNDALYTFLDKNQKTLSRYEAVEEFNPLERAWYAKAMQNDKGVISVKPYKYKSDSKYGTTYSAQTSQEGTVFSIDVSLEKINQILFSQIFEEDMEIFLFNKKGEKIASSNSDFRDIDAKLLKLFFSNPKGESLRLDVNDKNYLISYDNVKNKEIFLGIRLNSRNLLKPYNDNLKYSFSIALLLLLISIPLIFLATNVIVNPIKLLILENDKIKNRKFSEVRRVKTNIIEFIELSKSLVAMSISIQEYQKSQEALLDSIVKLIAEAVDAKSPYTGGHCKRVPKIAQMLVDEASRSNEGIFKGFKLDSEEELREFEIGAWLHDCGKVTTPEYVVDKSTKLETINDRIHEVRTRFEVLWRDAQISYLEAKLHGKDENQALKTLNATQEKLLDDFNFIASANVGGEFMSEEKQSRVREIAEIEWIRNFDDSLGLGEVEILRYDEQSAQTLPAREKLLSDKKQHIVKRENFNYEAYEKEGFKEEVPEHLYNYGEVYNLCIAKGTLSPEERYKINEHVILTIKMLEKIPFPSQMTKIPEYAGTHHETLIGNGYPRRLTKEELSIPARIMAVADVFEALTASDRPYKKAKTLSASIKILSFMVKDKHLDEDIFKLFLRSGLHITYAKRYLKPEQIDEVDVERYL